MRRGVGGEVCLEGQTGRRRADVVVEVRVTAVEGGQQGICCKVDGGRRSIQVRRGVLGSIIRRLRVRSFGRPVVGVG